ncbi:hypothetical protein [Alistipes finegoldii]|uniref:hypothetical protein n=1 Tax=Alistipes finegoldii TaxID=214856 RepID=UPI000334EC98|nr:hypothetical protein [Alistipes finegoldii]CCZ75308.1 uncharacterized protein BN754_00931 [Alistipes finegoldii CAG:68]
MKEQDERIERLLECYFDARTTEAEERELRDYFRYVDEIPASLRYARTMFGGLDALAEERYPGEGSVQTGPAVRPAEGMRRYETRSAAGRGARGGRKLRPLWGVVAAAAVVLGVFFYAEYLRKPYCYIDGVAIYDKEAAMQATVYLQGLSDFGDQVRMVDELIINE